MEQKWDKTNPLGRAGVNDGFSSLRVDGPSLNPQLKGGR